MINSQIKGLLLSLDRKSKAAEGETPARKVKTATYTVGKKYETPVCTQVLY